MNDVNSASQVFMPSAPAGAVPPGSYVIPLDRARFILKAQFFHPVKESDEPLPLHQFDLVCVSPQGTPSVRGQPSQDDGVSWINYKDDMSEEVAGSVWALAWRPLIKAADGSYAQVAGSETGDAWLDLDAMQWVASADIGVVDKRKLLRLPRWVSYLKVKQGGFKESPKSTSFGQTGLLEYDKNGLKPYGDRSKPWVVQIDQGLFRSYVRFAYYDLKEKARKPVPPGLIVHAIGARALTGPATGTDSRVAAGTAIDDDGTFYFVHERTKANLAKAKFDYFFFTGKIGQDDHVMIDFSQSGPRDKITIVAREPSPKRDQRYVLPREWHSNGMQAWTQEDGNGVPQRKDFKTLRTVDTSKSAPLQFHLDDAILAATPDIPSAPSKGARISILDHMLHLRDVDPKKPHLWQTELERNYLPAENAVFVGGEGTEKMTRIIFFEGVVHSLGEKRLQAHDGSSFGQVEGIGARAAVANDYDEKHARVSYMNGNPTMPDFLNQVKGRTVQHLIDVSDDIAHQVGGVDVKLLHLLVWIPVYFENGLGPAGKAVFEDNIPFLTAAAERWNQIHPAHPNQPPASHAPGEFVLAPVADDGAITAGMRIVRLRHFFAEVPATFPDGVKILITQSTDPGARAGANSASKLITMFKGDIGPVKDMNGESSQDASTSRFTLAHELGHILGFPDEYIEGHPTLGWRYAKWDQYMVAGAAARPFASDGPSMMNTNNKPRLRYYWHYANGVAAEPDFAKMVDANAYFPINLAPATGGKIVLERPFTSLIPDTVSAYHVVYSGLLGSRRCDATLYRLGTDEGTVERMYKKLGPEIGTAMPADKIYDALLLLRMKFMVQLDPSIYNDPLLRGIPFDKIQRLCLVGNVFAKQFAIETAPPVPKAKRAHDKPYLRRIFVAFMPEFDVANRYTTAAPPQPVPGGQHIAIDLVTARSTPNPLLSDTPPAALSLLMSEINESILLYALGWRPFIEDPVTHVRTLRTSLVASDLQFMADALHSWLGDDPAPLRAARDT